MTWKAAFKNLLKARYDKTVGNCPTKFWGNTWPQRCVWNTGSPELCSLGICQKKKKITHTLRVQFQRSHRTWHRHWGWLPRVGGRVSQEALPHHPETFGSYTGYVRWARIKHAAWYVCSPKFTGWNLTLNVIVFGGGLLWKVKVLRVPLVVGSAAL